MIDTIHFRIDIVPQLYDLIKKTGIRQKKQDLDSGHLFYDTSKHSISFMGDTTTTIGDISIPSWTYNIHYTCDERYLHIEFSLPKLLNGHNVDEIDLQQAKLSLQKLHNRLLEEFPDFPTYSLWEITRLDLCRVSKYKDESELERVLTGLKSVDYVNFKKYMYKTSVMWAGEQYSLKYYAKLPEFMKHDSKHIDNTSLLAELSNKANGLLRFEITMRSGLLKRLFGDNITIGKLSEEDLITLIDGYSGKLNKLQPIMMGLFEVRKLLQSKYSTTRATQLFMFYSSYFLGSHTQRQIIKEGFSRNQIYKNIRLLKEAGVGFSKEEEDDADGRVFSDHATHHLQTQFL